MRISGRSNSIDKTKLLTFLFTGMAGGILIVFFGRSRWLGENGLFCRELIDELKECTPDYMDFFRYVVLRRFFLFGLIAAICSSFVSDLIVLLGIVAAGVPVGMMFAALAVQYGLKGIILAVLWLFPHFILYGMAFLLLIVQFSQRSGCSGTGAVQRDRVWLLIMILMILTGTALESFLNPRILKIVLFFF